jgi:hypothetical protein
VQITPPVQRIRGWPGSTRRAGLLMISVLLGACDRSVPETRAPRVDSVTTAEPIPPAVSIDWRGWDARAGELVAVAPEDDPGIAFMVRPDADRAVATDTLWRTRVGADSMELIALDGSVTRATLRAAAPDSATRCEEWPSATVSPRPVAWAAGFPPDQVRPVPITPIDAMSPTDSAGIAAVAARIASAAPEAARSSLSGMPFTVERLHRMALAVAATDSAAARFGDTTMIAATLFRRLAQEADPREERWFVLAERTGRARNAPWLIRYLEFHDAREDEADGIALLAAVRVTASRQPGLLLARDGANGLALKWIAPTRTGEWRATWTSARARCRSD